MVELTAIEVGVRRETEEGSERLERLQREQEGTVGDPRAHSGQNARIPFPTRGNDAAGHQPLDEKAHSSRQMVGVPPVTRQTSILDVFSESRSSLVQSLQRIRTASKRKVSPTAQDARGARARRERGEEEEKETKKEENFQKTKKRNNIYHNRSKSSLAQPIMSFEVSSFSNSYSGICERETRRQENASDRAHECKSKGSPRG